MFGLLYAIGISFAIDYNGDNGDDDVKNNSFVKIIVKQIENFNYSKLMIHDYIQALLISLFRPITYFYQAMCYILMNYGGYSIYYMMPILQIFSMDVSIGSGDHDGGFVLYRV